MRLSVPIGLATLLVSVAALIFALALAIPSSAPGVGAAADSDGDGIEDSVDDCWLTPEDFDEVDDGDGCPDSDAEMVSLSFPSTFSVVLNQPTPVLVDFDVANGNFPGDLHILLQVSMPTNCPADWVGESGDQVAGFDGGSTHFSTLEFDLASVAAGATNSLSRTMVIVCSIIGASGSVLASVTTQGDVNAPNPVREEDASNNVLFRTLTAGLDADGDGVSDDNDNCPDAANGPNEASIPGVGNQTNSDKALNLEGVTIYGATVPADDFGNACDDDDDNDSPTAFPNDWPDEVEFYLTNDATAQMEACPRTTGPSGDDFWMPDNNHDRIINVLDLLPFKAQFKEVGPFAVGDPARRQDYNMDDVIDVLDLLPLKHAFKATCTVP